MPFVLLLFALVQPVAPLRVYVHAAPSPDGFVDAALKDRQATAFDVVKALREARYASLFTVVERREDADLVCEVTWRGEEDTGATSTKKNWAPPGQQQMAGSRETPVLQNNIRLTVTIGDKAREFYGIEPGKRATRFWSDLAKEAVKSLAAFVTENRAQITAR